MALKDKESVRLAKVARDLQVGVGTLVEYLQRNGVVVENSPNAKIDGASYAMLQKEYGATVPTQAPVQAATPARPAGEKPQSIGDVLGKATSAHADGEVNEPTGHPAKPEIALKVKGKISLEQPQASAAAESADSCTQPVDRAVSAKGATPVAPKENAEQPAPQGPEAESERKKGSTASKVAPEGAQQPAEPSTPAQEERPTKPVAKDSTPATAEQPVAPKAQVPPVEAPVVVDAKVEEPGTQSQKDRSEKHAAPTPSQQEPKKGEAQPTQQPSRAEREEAPEIVKTAGEAARQAEMTGPKVLGHMELTEQPRRSGRRRGKEIVPKVAPTQPQESRGKEALHAGKDESHPGKVRPSEQHPTPQTAPQEHREPVQPKEPEIFRQDVEKLSGPTVLGKIDLEALNDHSRRKPEASATPGGALQKRRRRGKAGNAPAPHHPAGTQGGGGRPFASGGGGKSKKGKGQPRREVPQHAEITKAAVDEALKETQARMVSRRGGALAKGVKYRHEKRSLMEARRTEEMERSEQERKTLRISEFVSVNELAGLMEVPATDVIETCMNMGLMVSINMRLDAESIALVADEFGFKVEFLSLDTIGHEEAVEDRPEDLVSRPPVFTVLGHVDHGKTKLCDAIRKANVVEGEAGGITQHLSAYSLTLPNGRKMTLIDTPGHKAFTAMRARGAKMTDVAIIVISAVEGVMPQTVEAINHASVAGSRIVFALNFMDMPNANPERVKEQLANMNYMVEDWGGKYQSQEISAKTNLNIDKLLEKVLLEADLLELKANPNRKPEVTVLESTIDKGRGHCANVLVHTGTLRKGDSIVAGACYGRVKMMLNDRGKEVKEAGPSMPVNVYGLNGSPQAGDTLLVMDSDREARAAANEIGKVRRMQELHTRKHITLDEIGRRLAIGNFQELNLVVKADVDGTVEALSDSLIGLSTEEIKVNVIHRGVGQITETDVNMASTSNAIIIGFQVRPSQAAKRLAENEQIDIRLYSIIYDAINEVKSAMEGMLSPEVKETIRGSAEVMEVFKISKVGTVAGCIVREGKILKGNKIRLIRDGIVVYTNELASLKRFKDEVKEVATGQDCGLNIKDYNDVKVGDFIESFEEVEVKRTL
jgi:translation initiation factor IF-2